VTHLLHFMRRGLLGRLERQTFLKEGKPTEASFALCQLCRDILLNDTATALQAVEVNAVTPALERVVEANTLLSGLGFESGGLYITHSIHNGLTSQPNHLSYTHGEKVAFGLLTQLVLEGKPKAEIDEVVQFCVDVGLPVTLDDVGVNADNEMDQSHHQSLSQSQRQHPPRHWQHQSHLRMWRH